MATQATARSMPAPVPNPENQPYFDAAAQGRLMFKRCQDCAKPHFYPRALCPYCLSDRTEWVQAEGNGTIYSYSVMRRGVPVPYALAYVTLDEGVTMLTNIVDTDLDAIRIGARVRVAFRPAEGGIPVPVFSQT
jgi:uncharacterized protein